MYSPPPITIYTLGSDRSNGILTDYPCSSAFLALAFRFLEPWNQTLLFANSCNDGRIVDAQAVLHEYAEEVAIVKGPVVVVR